MRTFHTGGVAVKISHKVCVWKNYLKHANRKVWPLLLDEDGVVEIVETRQRREIRVTPEGAKQKSYPIPYGSRLKVKDGERVEAGRNLRKAPLTHMISCG